jgi:hypothetical protein
MRKNWTILVIIIVVLTFVSITIYQSLRGNKTADSRACDTVKMALSGVIKAFGGRNPSVFLVLNNVKGSIGVNFSREGDKRGFTGDYCFEPGDSVIKSAGSRLITFKRGDSLAVFKLNCVE